MRQLIFVEDDGFRMSLEKTEEFLHVIATFADGRQSETKFKKGGEVYSVVELPDLSVLKATMLRFIEQRACKSQKSTD